MLSIPKELLMRVLEFTGTQEDWDHYYTLIDVQSVYCTCKSFEWLSTLSYMKAVVSEPIFKYMTVDINNVLNGPLFILEQAYTGGIIFKGVIYYVNGEVVGNHILEYESGTPVVNGNALIIWGDDFSVFDEWLSDAYEQWNIVDPVSKKWVESVLWKEEEHENLLIRWNYPNNTFFIPYDKEFEWRPLEK